MSQSNCVLRRRRFLRGALDVAATSLGSALLVPAWAQEASQSVVSKALTPKAGNYQNILILVELKGANDGLNTVVPYTDPKYAEIRPKIALKPDQLLKISDKEGLHPSLEPLMALWSQKELAIVQGIGYPRPNQSHFRSIEIWDTASNSEDYLDAGWLARTFRSTPVPIKFAADGVVVGSNDMGPLSGLGVRAIALADTAQFLRNAKLAKPNQDTRNAALRHLLNVENEIVHASGKMNTNYVFKTEFPKNGFGYQVRTAAQLVASKAGTAVVRLTLGGFDTHAGQLGTHANLLKELADGMVALKAAMQELNMWNNTLVMTYAEFGRRAKGNDSNGTDHGTANVHFLTGGKVAGGLFGQAPQLNKLDGNGNLPFAVDFRSLYATIIDQWWSGDSQSVLSAKFAHLPVLKA